MLTHKICKRCDQKLEINMFSPSKYIKDGYENKCKKCREEQRPKHEFTCEYCGEKFLSNKKEAKFCNITCQHGVQNKQISKPCAYCGEKVTRPPAFIKGFEQVYCNQGCRTLHLKDLMKGERNPNFNRIQTNCGNCNKEIYEIPFKVNTQKYIYCSRKCYKEHRRFLMTGESNPVWKPTRTREERMKSRTLAHYKEWRLACFERDNYSCLCCGNNKSGNLVVHHKNGWDNFPEERYDVSNGVTLCKSCHLDFHRIYKFGGNTKEQFNEWLNSRTVI